MARGRQIDSTPLCNFYLDGQIDLKLGMLIVFGEGIKINTKIEKKNGQEVAQNADISIFEHLSMKTGHSQEML